MDEIDEKIIDAMKKKNLCTPRVSEIAKELGMPTSTVHTRLKNLEKKGIIKNYVPIIDLEKTGPYIESFVFLKVSPGVYYKEYIERIKKLNFVKDIHILTGEWAIIVRIRVKNFDNYNNAIQNLTVDKNIMSSQDIISTKCIKKEN
ncbi:MAG: winged helix-turn-helix transcriptional regulator [archaeon]